MGLDTTHDAWHGAYSAFDRWRQAVAQVAGISNGTIEAAFAAKPERLSGLGWDEVPADPILILLAHSDCDGHIEPEHAGLIADRLEQLLPSLANLGCGGWHIGAFDVKTQTFIAGCRAAAEAGERLEFW